MPKRKPSRSRRRRGARPPAPPVVAVPSRPAPRPVPVAAPREPGPAREASVTRFTARDYTYVRREIQRIVLLAALIIVAIIVLSFFLP